MIKSRFCQMFFYNTRFFAAILALTLFLAGATTQPFAEPAELVFPAYWEKPSYDFPKSLNP